MKKSMKQYVVWLFITLLLVSVVSLSGIIEASAAVDPFAAMYDSDALFLEKAERMLQDEYDTTAYNQDLASIGVVGLDGVVPDMESLSMQQSTKSAPSKQLSGNTDFKLDSRQLLEIVRNSGLDNLVEFSISDISQDMITQIYEQSRVDRFIVKYKNGENIRSVQDMANVSIVQVHALSTEPVLSAKGRIIAPTLSTGVPGRLECIVLSEKVNPAEFASQLKATGIAAEIEYIQPDFILSFAGLELSYEEVSSITGDDHEGILPEEKTTSGDTPPGDTPPGGTPSDELPTEELPPDELPLEELLPEEIPIPLEEIIPEEIVVALIDTGMDIWHPALRNAIVGGWNFVDDTNNVYDNRQPMQNAHGTHIAGIIAQSTDDYVKIMPLQVFGEHGAYTSDIIKAITYAEEHGVRIVNCSFGSSSDNRALREAMENSSMLFVAAAGNARSDLAEAPVYPAAFGLDNIISVASLNEDSGFSYYSNYSSSLVDIAARGRDVESALPGGEYGLQSGTSMAAGYVSAAAGLVLSENSRLAAAELKERLCVTGDKMAHLQNKVRNGRSLDVIQALSGESQSSMVHLNPEEDFDIHGYAPTPEESWALFSSKRVADIVAGSRHTLALCDDGTVWAWGHNDYGQLGDASTVQRSTPVQVVGLTNVTAIAAGEYYSLAIKEGGTVWAWGYNNYGQLGNGGSTQIPVPMQVSGLTDIVAISAGGSHSMALHSNGSVYTWGYNGYGQLGNGTTTNASAPVLVSGITDITDISAGYQHSMALCSNGSVHTWGRNSYGSLGDGTTTNRTTAVQIGGLNGVVKIATGEYYSQALKEDGTLLAWGYNNHGQLGDGTTTTRTAPVVVSGIEGVKELGPGSYHSLVIKKDGTVWVWGTNTSNQLGNGGTVDSYLPQQVNGLSNVVGVSGGYFHGIALRKDGTLWVWGRNNYGQLGDGTTTNRTTPTQIQKSFFSLSGGSLSFAQDQYQANIPGAGTLIIPLVAMLRNAEGEVIDGEIRYTLFSPYPGISIDEITGEVTINSEAQPGTVTITAASGELITKVELILSEPLPVEVTIYTVAGRQYDIALFARDIASFSGMEITITYDAAVFEVVDLCSFTKEKIVNIGSIEAAGLTISHLQPGEIRFTVDKTIPPGRLWSGALNVIRLSARDTAQSIIQVK